MDTELRLCGKGKDVDDTGRDSVTAEVSHIYFYLAACLCGKESQAKQTYFSSPVSEKSRYTVKACPSWKLRLVHYEQQHSQGTQLSARLQKALSIKQKSFKITIKTKKYNKKMMRYKDIPNFVAQQGDDNYKTKMSLFCSACEIVIIDSR